MSRGGLAAPRKGAVHLEAVERVKGWTRERFALGEGDTVVLQESPCTLPGFPPSETLVAFWTGGERHHFKVFKPVEEVRDEDLPPGWMKAALAGDIACECC
jgi:nitrate reductase delta subunit